MLRKMFHIFDPSQLLLSYSRNLSVLFIHKIGQFFYLPLPLCGCHMYMAPNRDGEGERRSLISSISHPVVSANKRMRRWDLLK